MNLLVTPTCNLDCTYCFAGSFNQRLSAREMTFSELERVVSSLDPEKDPVRLMGGEPTLHSQYPEILRWLKERGYQVVVFSNGTQPALRNTAPLLPDRVLLNLNDQTAYHKNHLRQIQANLVTLGERIGLAYTITRPEFDLTWHRYLVLAEELQPVIRLGLAQPVLSGDNVYLPDADLRAAHAAVVHWAKTLAGDGIRISLDCGFMRCHFSEADLEILIRSGTSLRFECSPAVDLGPGLEAWRCYAFTRQKGLTWADFESESACLEWFTQEKMPVDPACTQCPHLKSGWCQGGCRARALMKT